MGENCTSNSRLLVHKSIKDEFVKLIVEKTEALRTGDPFDPENNLGALVEIPHMNKVLNYIEIAKKEGGRLLTGGGRILEETGGNFVAPTVFDGITPDMTIAREEIFGPVLPILGMDEPRHYRCSGSWNLRQRKKRSASRTIRNTAFRPRSSPMTSAPRIG